MNLPRVVYGIASATGNFLVWIGSDKEKAYCFADGNRAIIEYRSEAELAERVAAAEEAGWNAAYDAVQSGAKLERNGQRGVLARYVAAARLEGARAALEEVANHLGNEIAQHEKIADDGGIVNGLLSGLIIWIRTLARDPELGEKLRDRTAKA